MGNTVVLDTIDRLLGEGRRVLGTEFDAGHPEAVYFGNRPRGVDLQQFAKLKAGCANLLRVLGPAADPWKEAFALPENNPLVVRLMLGTLEAIREAVQRGLLVKVEDLVRAEAFDSLLGQADYLFGEGYYLAAGVIGRAVLEEHLRKWCDLTGCVPVKPKPTLNDYKDSLYKAKHLSVVTMKHLESLAAVGNDAAHNAPSLDRGDVGRMLRDVRDVLVRHPLS